MSKFRFPLLIVAAILVAISMPVTQNSHVQAKEPARSMYPALLAIQAAGAPAQPAQPANPADLLPPGAGRDTTVQVCTTCHGVDQFSQLRYTPDHWDEVLNDMISKGMDASDDDLATTRKYLVTFMAPPPSQGKSPSDSGPSSSSSSPKSTSSQGKGSSSSSSSPKSTSSQPAGSSNSSPPPKSN